ncbi:hypothetical protein Tco_0669916 [Tanacetum coccineum]
MRAAFSSTLKSLAIMTGKLVGATKMRIRDERGLGNDGSSLRKNGFKKKNILLGFLVRVINFGELDHLQERGKRRLPQEENHYPRRE